MGLIKSITFLMREYQSQRRTRDTSPTHRPCQPCRHLSKKKKERKGWRKKEIKKGMEEEREKERDKLIVRAVQSLILCGNGRA